MKLTKKQRADILNVFRKWTDEEAARAGEWAINGMPILCGTKEVYEVVLTGDGAL